MSGIRNLKVPVKVEWITENTVALFVNNKLIKIMGINLTGG